MTLNDLLQCEVVDESHERIGKVHDVRLVRRGPELGEAGAALLVEGLMVGARGFGSRLGFSRRKVKAPWVLKRFFASMHGGIKLVPWDKIATVDGKRIVIRGTSEDLGAPDDLS